MRFAQFPLETRSGGIVHPIVWSSDRHPRRAEGESDKIIAV
jgi:hypothetical protein